MEDLQIKTVVQIIPSSGLWLRTVVVEGPALPGAEFKPIVAIALVEIEAPHDRLFASQGLLPVTSDDLMRGLIERFPNERLRVDLSIFHDADFEEVGVRLKPDAVPRSTYNWTRASGLDFARFLLDRERGDV